MENAHSSLCHLFRHTTRGKTKTCLDFLGGFLTKTLGSGTRSMAGLGKHRRHLSGGDPFSDVIVLQRSMKCFTGNPLA